MLTVPGLRRLAPGTQGCGKEAAFRGCPRLGSVEDQADRERILSALRSQLRARDV